MSQKKKTIHQQTEIESIKDENVKEFQLIHMPPYACQRKTIESENKNEFITNCLQEIENYYYYTGDYSHQIAYQRVIAVLKACPIKIKNANQLKDIVYIGSKMIKKINSIINTGTLDTYKLTQTEEAKILKLFTNVYGIGPSTAKNWLEQNCSTLENVLKLHSEGKLSPPLNSTQELCIKYINDMNTEITKEDQELIIKLIRKGLNKISKNVQYLICGSIRRKISNNYDMDILIKNSDANLNELDILNKLVDIIKPKYILNKSQEINQSKIYRENSRHPNTICLIDLMNESPLRKIAIAVVPSSEWGFAVIGWTGSIYFEKSLRLYAKEIKGWNISNHGIFKINSGDKMPFDFYDEEKIFNVLDLEYRLPEERSC